MSLNRYEARLRLSLESPFVSHGLTAAAWGIDVAQCRASDGRAVLPGDLIRGNLRHAVEEMGLDPVPLFGRTIAKGDDNGEGSDSVRGNLIIGDLVAQIDDRPTVLTRVAIDDDTGAAKTGALLDVELSHPIGQVVPFEGPLVVFAPSEAVFDDLRAALDRIVAVGAFKSVGFGVVVCRAIEVRDRRPLAPLPALRRDLGDRVSLTLRFDRPLLVDARRVADNVYHGQAVVPGAVVKGALANRLRRGGIGGLDDALTRMVVGHAFPLHPDGTGRLSHRPLPLSLVTDESGERVADLLFAPPDRAPPLIGGTAPRFALDWKTTHHEAVRKDLTWPKDIDIPHDTRTRTAIERESGVSAESLLFAFSALVTDGLCWRAVIDRNGADKAAFATLLAVLAEGLDGIGKTDASAAIELAAAPLDPLPPRNEPRWAVTLRTPAILNGDPARLRETPDLWADYGAYWAKAVPGARLVNFFATQRLAGGWQALKSRRDAYYPTLLTEPGSVFLLEGGAPARIESLLRSGLPLPGWLAGATWETCAFVPENGFGAIDIDLIDHEALGRRINHD